MTVLRFLQRPEHGQGELLFVSASFPALSLQIYGVVLRLSRRSSFSLCSRASPTLSIQTVVALPRIFFCMMVNTCTHTHTVTHTGRCATAGLSPGFCSVATSPRRGLARGRRLERSLCLDKGALARLDEVFRVEPFLDLSWSPGHRGSTRVRRILNTTTILLWT